MPTDGLSVLLQALHATKRGGGWMAVCPHHHDANPSLDIKIGRKGCPVVICRVCGGDQQRAVVADIEALGVPKWVWFSEYEPTGEDAPKPRVVKETPYELRDWNGTLVATHVRRDLDRPNAKGKLKEFAYLRDGKYSLAGLSPNQLPLWGTELLRQYPKHGVVITEGERDAGALRAAGVKLALGTLGAETRPAREVLQVLAGRKRYILWPDQDEPGKAHMAWLADALVAAGVPAELIQIVDWPEGLKGAGAADYLATHSNSQVTEFLSHAPYWRRPPEEGPPADPLPPAPPPEVVAANGVGPHSALLLTWAKDLTPTEVEWLWQGYLPRGRIAILQGDPGLGKSWFALAVATSLSLGAPLPHQQQLQEQPPQRTLLFAAEDDPNDTLAMRLTMMGADPSHVAILRAAELVDDKGKARQEHFTFGRHLALLDATLAEHKFSLLVFDPLSAYFGASVDSHKDNEVRSIMGPLQEVVMRHKVACLCIMHLTKGSRDRAIYRGQGSIAFGALARVILLAGREPLRPERIAVVQIKNNLAPYAPTLAFDLQEDRLLWVPEGSEATEEDLLAAAPTSEERTALQDCGDSILDLLQEGSMEARKLEGKLHGQGFTTATIRRARRELTARAAIDTERRGGLGGEGKWHVFLVQRGE